MIRTFLGASKVPTRAQLRPSLRLLSHTTAVRNEWFGDLTKKTTPELPKTEGNADEVVTNPAPKDDTQLQEYYMKQAREQQIRSDKYISPLKRRLFDLNVAQNGFFKNNTVVTDPDTSKSYKVSLTEQEIEILEPSIYLQSYRIKLSMKKATLVNRFVRGFTVKHAISQLHFNPKKMSTELEKFLKTGLEQAQKLGYNEDGLYIHALWTGSDGEWRKRLDAKGRGRTGIIEHPYIHLKAVLKTDQTTKRRQWEQAQAQRAAKPRMFLNNEPLNFKVRGHYKW
jgi:ribosomal protein L22